MGGILSTQKNKKGVNVVENERVCKMSEEQIFNPILNGLVHPANCQVFKNDEIVPLIQKLVVGLRQLEITICKNYENVYEDNYFKEGDKITVKVFKPDNTCVIRNYAVSRVCDVQTEVDVKSPVVNTIYRLDTDYLD